MSKEIYLKRMYSIPKNYRKYIEINPNDRFAKPFLKGTGVSVYDVLSWLSSKMSSANIVEEYPNLTIGSIRACLAFAEDRKETNR